MKTHSKRWLMSRMKTSGSKKRHVLNGRFADERHTKRARSFKDYPTVESVKATHRFYYGKINYGLLVRFLRTQVGANWDEVYSAIIRRIPTKLLDYKEMVFWFVAKSVEITPDGLWNKESQKIIWTDGSSESKYSADQRDKLEFIEFYVDPITNKLTQLPSKPRNTATAKCA